MGSGTSVINVGNTTIDLNDYECSNRGLILPSKYSAKTFLGWGFLSAQKITKLSRQRSATILLFYDTRIEYSYKRVA